jgi:hypothetical protein
MYFTNHTNINYKNKKIVNILSSVKLNTVNKNYIIYPYVVEPTDKPETVSLRIYQTASFYWTILIINNIVNPYEEWIKTTPVLEKYTEKKYINGIKNFNNEILLNSTGIYGIHHYINTNTNTELDQINDAYYRALSPQNLPNNILPITNIEYENEINTKKAHIYLIRPEYIIDFVLAYETALKEKINVSTR